MRLKGLVTAVGMSSVLLLSSLSFTGCNKVTEEQLAQLQELRKQERSLNQQISDLNAEISKIERELKSRKSELDDCTEKKEFVKQKLSQWPNVWPD